MPPAGTGRVFQEAVQQKLHAEVVDGAAEKDRGGLVREYGGIVPVVPGVFEHFQLLYRLVEGRVIKPAADEFVVQPAHLHGRAILAADRALEKVHLLRLTVKDALKLEAVADGPVHRERADAQHSLQLIQQGERLFHRAIALVDEGEDRHATLPANLEELAGLRLDALGGINHHHDRIHGSEHAIGVLGKVFVTWCVQQIEAVAGVIELQHGRADGDATLLFQFHPIGGRRALVLARGDRAGELHRAAVKQELFRQRGLARVRMRDDGERAPRLNCSYRFHKDANNSTESPWDKLRLTQLLVAQWQAPTCGGGRKSLADEMGGDGARVGRAAVLPEIDPLPSAQCQPALTDRNGKVDRRKRGAHVCWHVVVALNGVREERIAIRHKPGEELLQITPHVRVGVLLNQQGGGGVAKIEGHQAVSEATL